MKVCDGVYAYIWKSVFENNCNMYYFAEPLNILFDPGLSHHMDGRFNEMKKDGLNPDNIKYIINTHSHPDHFEGSLGFMNNSTVQVGMHKDEISFFNEVGPAFFEMFGLKFPKTKFDIVLDEGKWNVSGTDLEIYCTPGHSPGSISIYWPAKKALVCGDVIFKRSVGRVDFPGGDGNLLIESIERMSKLDIEILLPGHMELLEGKSEIEKNFEFIRHFF